MPRLLTATELDDPFPQRNQLPFNLLFLDQTPRSAFRLATGESRFMVHFTHENTLVGTDDLIAAFVADDFATFGGEVTEPLLATVAAASQGKSAFFIDGETLRTVLDGAVGIGPRFEIGIEIPFLMHTAGRFDGVIDNYHERFGFPDGGRPGFIRYRFVGGYVGDGESVFIEGSPGGIGLGDIVLSGRFSLADDRGRVPAVSVELNVKFATGNPHRLEGSGHNDYGAGVRISKRLGRSTLHGGYAYSFLGDWALAPGLPISDARSLAGIYVFSVSPRTAFVGQLLRSSGAFPFRAGSDLGKTATEISLGTRHRMRGHSWFEWAIIENLSTDHNTPDIGLFVGFSIRPTTGH